MATEQLNVGKIVQVIGPVIDVEFAAGHLPEIYNALRIQSDAQGGREAIDVIAEVEQHLGENRVRAVAMKPTDGMQRGMNVTDLGEPITIPVGPETLGRVLNVLGEPVDFRGRSFDAFDLLYTGRSLSPAAVADRLIATAERALLQ